MMVLVVEGLDFRFYRSFPNIVRILTRKKRIDSAERPLSIRFVPTELLCILTLFIGMSNYNMFTY